VEGGGLGGGGQLSKVSLVSEIDAGSELIT
jgi:hypothetical protein